MKMRTGLCSVCGRYIGNFNHAHITDEKSLYKTTSGTDNNRTKCKHANGVFHYVHFWIFTKRIYFCTDCETFIVK